MHLADGTNVNQALVKEGMGWWYRKYAPQDTMLEKWETDAREAAKGLWSDSNPPPWGWRRRPQRSGDKLTGSRDTLRSVSVDAPVLYWYAPPGGLVH